MQILFKNLFNSMNLFEYCYGSAYLGLFVKDTLRYRKINLFTTSALFNCIFRVNGGEKGLAHSIHKFDAIAGDRVLGRTFADIQKHYDNKEAKALGGTKSFPESFRENERKYSISGAPTKKFYDLA